MKRSELEEIIEQEIYEYSNGLEEKSVPQPYDRKKARKMSSSQVSDRDKIGKKMKANPKTVARFRKKYGDEWEDYLWASASSRALGGGFKKKGGSSKSTPKKSAKKSTPKSSTPAKKREKIDLTPAQRNVARGMQRDLKKLGALDEQKFYEYVTALDKRFSMLHESQSHINGGLMKKILYKIVNRIKPSEDSI